jgi:hypothetical protein
VTSERTKDRFLIAALLILSLFWAGFNLSGCATMAQADYIERPPEAFQKPNTVTVEFVSPEAAPIRCLERGLLIPAYACGSKSLVTLPNPCAFRGKFAELTCHELARSNGWGTGGLTPPPASQSPQALALDNIKKGAKH